MSSASDSIDWFTRLAVAVAGFLGATGVVAAAAASHVGEPRIPGALALIALTQARAILALGLYGDGRLFRLATIAIGLGALLFSADLASRHLTGERLFPMSAPIGGSAMITGWLLLIPAAILWRRPRATQPSPRS